jgi:aldehyde:ferredoxin oxidoreductase
MMEKFYGYAGKTLKVDLTKGKVVQEPLERDLARKFLGGRGLNAKLLFDHVGPNVEALSPKNVLLIATGPINGLLGLTTGRLDVTSLSPLTGIFGNSNAGTNFAPELKYAGFDNIMVFGRAKNPVYLLIEDGQVELKDASDLKGAGVFETTDLLKERHDDVKVAAVGRAAENGVLYGSIIFDYWDAAGRTGMGTVMASKNLKAIAVRGSGSIEVADPDKYYEVAKDGWLALMNDFGFKTQEHSVLGTAVCVGWGNAQGWLPTRNFRESHFEEADKISGEEFRDRFSVKDSPIPAGRACMSCPNRCKRFGVIKSGKYAGTRGNIEFESIAAFGSKCGVGDFDAVFHANMIANDYGLDTVSCGNMIATFMEWREEGIIDEKFLEGLDLRFGNADAMVEAIHKIANREGKIGELGALGSYLAAKAIGEKALYYTSNIKGMDSIACDPRAAKGFGFAFAVASRGSDHLRAHPVFEMIKMLPEVGKELFGDAEAVDLRKYGGKPEMVAWHEEIAAITDSIGSCRFMHASYYTQYPVPELLHKYLKLKGEAHSVKYHEWISAATGWKISYEELLRIGKRIITVERAFNIRRGIGRKDDTLPERFFRNKIPKGPAKGEVYSKETFNKMLDRYYEIRGWDLETGLIKRETLEDLELQDVMRVLEREGLVV